MKVQGVAVKFILVLLIFFAITVVQAGADSISYLHGTGGRYIGVGVDAFGTDVRGAYVQEQISPPWEFATPGAPFQADMVIHSTLLPGTTVSASASQISQFGPTSFQASGAAAAAASITDQGGARAFGNGDSFLGTNFWLMTNSLVTITGSVAGNGSIQPTPTDPVAAYLAYIRLAPLFFEGPDITRVNVGNFCPPYKNGLTLNTIQFQQMLPAGYYSLGAWAHVDLTTEYAYAYDPLGLGTWYCQASYDFTFTASPVPIPGAFWLLGSGLLGLAGWRRFRKG